MQALHRQFERQRSPPKKRQRKEKKKRRRLNQKIKAFHMEQILDLRYNRQMSYPMIGRTLTLKPASIHLALKKYQQRGAFIDQRIHNGHNNPRHKIGAELRHQLLDRKLLQQWSGYNLQQRCMMLERDFGLKISLKGLQKFYRRNNVRYLSVGYIYAQALAKNSSAVETFGMQLAKVIAAGTPLVYFDEASFNLWLRNRKTWTPNEEPIKYPLGRNRGKGITVMGAISQHLGKPLFSLEVSTNSTAFKSFLRKLRQRFPLKKTRVTIVLDNARAHQTTDVKALAEELNLELMFMPPYCPEFNCIEALWSVLKKDFKRRVLLQQKVEISDDLFRRLLQESLDSVTPKVQQHAARYNNRGFMHLVTGKVANKGLDFIEEDLPSIDSVMDIDSVDEEIKLMEEALESRLPARALAAEVAVPANPNPP